VDKDKIADGMRVYQLQGGWVIPSIEPHVNVIFNVETAFQRMLDWRIGGVQESKVG
jgi:hypothetical protein